MPVELNPVKDLFLASLEKTAPAERSAFLDDACAGDAVLRQRVEALLHAHSEPDQLLDRPAVALVGASQELTQALGASTDGAAVTLASPFSALGQTQAESNRNGCEADDALALLTPSQEPTSLGRLDHYEVLQVVGRGGMGVVFKARDKSLERVVAIKMLAPALAASGTSRKRFEREAKAAAAITHEHVVAIHAVESAGPAPYLVMEFVGGITLDDRIKQSGPLELKEILRIGMQTAKGLAAAHAQGLVHRDVKPANILLENGVQRVKITDFGLARAVDDASLTQSGVIAGTPLYMSPEQARGEALDHRADLFSLGSVLYTLCTGHPPFRASHTVAVLKRVCEDTPRPIREVNPDIPDWLCAIISKLQAKEPTQRFQTAAEVAELLSQHLAHVQQPQMIPPPPALRPVEQAPIRRRRSPMVLAASALAAAALLFALVGGVAYWMWPKPAPHNPPPDTIVRPTTSPFDDRKREDIPRALLALAGGGDPDQSPPELVAILGDIERFKLPGDGSGAWMAASPDGMMLAVSQGINIVLFDAQTGASLRILTGHTGAIPSVAFSPDSKRLVSASIDHSVRVWDATTGQEVRVLNGHTDTVHRVAFSPDGKSIASASGDKTIRVWDAKTGEPTLTITGQTVGFHTVGFTPDNERIVSTNFANLLEVWDVSDGTKVLEREGHTSLPQTTAFSPDGTYLATGSDNEFILWDAKSFNKIKTESTPAGYVGFTPDSRILVLANAARLVTRWDVATRKEQAKLRLKSNHDGVAFSQLSSDGKVIFVRRGGPTQDPFVAVYDAETGKELLFPHQGHKGPVYGVAVSPDGKLLASAGADRLVRIWNLAEWKKGDSLPPVRPLEGHADTVNVLAFSPNGKLLASASRDLTIAIWDVESGKEVHTLSGGALIMIRMEFSSDGQTLAAGCEDGGVRLYKLTGDKEGVLLCRHRGRVRSVAFNPAGTLLASAGEDAQLRVTDLATGRPVQTFTLPNKVNNVTFSADGKTLAAVCDFPDGAVRLWEVADRKGEWKNVTLPGHSGNVGGLAFSPVAPLLATGASDGTLSFWDLTVSSPRSLSIGPGPFGGQVVPVFTPDGHYVVTPNNVNGTIAVLKVPSPPKPYDPGPPWKLPDPLELAQRPSAADALKREDIPADLLAKAGGGDPQKAPPELVAVLAKEGTNGQVTSVSISPDGKTLASADLDKTVKLWDLATAKLRATLTGHTNVVQRVTFSPDGKTLASTGEDGTIRLWDAATGKPLYTLTGHVGSVLRIAFSPDSKTLASAGQDGTVRLWNVTTGKIRRLVVAQPGVASCVGFSPDGKTLATARWYVNDISVRLWDLTTGWQIGALQGPDNGLWSVDFHPDGRTLAACGEEKHTISVWDLATGQLKQTVAGLEGGVIDQAWSTDGRLLASAGADDGTARVWDMTATPARRKVFRLLPFVNVRWLRAVALTPEGRYLATANPDGTIYILRLAERGEVYEIPPDPVELQLKARIPAHEGAVTWTAFFADGKTLASAGKDGVLKLWNVGEQRWGIPAHAGGVRVLAASPDGKTLATAGFDGIIRLWDADGKQLHELPGHKGGVAPLLFAPNSEQLLSGGADGCVRFWDVKEGKEAKKIDASKDWITHLSLTPDGKTLATSGNDGIVRLWDVDTGEERTSLPERNSACFSPDGKRLAVATPDHCIKVLDAETLEMRAVFVGHQDKPDCLQFSADGKLLASCGADGSLRLWDASHGHLLAVLRGHKGRVWSVTLAADGKTLAAGDADGKLLLWDVSGLSTRPGR